MNIVFFGTPEAALPSLEKLISAGHSIKLVVTQPDRPSGRGQKTKPPPVKEWARQHKLPVIQPAKIRLDEAAQELIRACAPEIIVVVAYGQILPARIIYFPPFRSVNVHFSLLPLYRGACPVAWAILRGEKKTGVTIFQLNERMDEGDILSQREVPILPHETAQDLEKRLAIIGAELLVETLAKIDKITPVPQDHSKATYAPKIEKEMGRIDWNQSAEQVDRQRRAFTPWPGVFTYFQGELIKIHAGFPLEEASFSGKPGEIVKIAREGVDVGCGYNSLYRLVLLQRQNRRAIAAYEFSLGMRLKPGDIFG